MKSQISNLGDFEPLTINKIGQYSVKGGNTYTLEGTGNAGTSQSTADFRRDDGAVACDVPDSASSNLDSWGGFH